MLQITINEKSVAAREGATIMEAAKQAGIRIPGLCRYKDIHRYGSCRICVVEVEGMKNLQASCMTTVQEGMVIRTQTPEIRSARKVLYELLLSNHPKDCLNCHRNQTCELQSLGYELGVTESRLEGERSANRPDISPAVTRDAGKCVLCRRCVTVCKQIQHVSAIDAQKRGFHTVIGPAMDLPLDTTACAMCGQCTLVCPTGALQETDGQAPVWKALADPGKHVVVQVDPAVRAALGEEFNLPCGVPVTGKTAAALHELGFDSVFDTLLAAELTMIAEGTELLKHLNAALTGGETALPIITGCSAGWIRHIRCRYPDEQNHLSACKRPHAMLGALVKSFYAEKTGKDAKDIFVVSVMPCTAEKTDEHSAVDAVLTARELARMIRADGIDFANLPEGDFDAPLRLPAGAAGISGVTGGVMEAALRTAYELAAGRELPFDNLHPARLNGQEQIRTAAITIEKALPEYKHLEGVTVHGAVTNGPEGISMLMKEVAAGMSPYHFIEVTGCAGGCINGGGQPRTREEGYYEKRLQALCREGGRTFRREPYKKPDSARVYEELRELLIPII